MHYLESKLMKYLDGKLYIKLPGAHSFCRWHLIGMLRHYANARSKDLLPARKTTGLPPTKLSDGYVVVPYLLEQGYKFVSPKTPIRLPSKYDPNEDFDTYAHL
jgi:hypothetical protein